MDLAGMRTVPARVAVMAMVTLLSTLGQAFAAERSITSFASGSAAIQSTVPTGAQTIRGAVDVSELYGLNGVYESTYLSVDETVSSATALLGYRYLGCVVDRRAFDSNSNSRRATLSALLDASSSSCMTFGSNCAGSTCTPWTYSGVVAVTGYWHDARYTTTGTYQYQTFDSVTKVSGRQNCIIATWDESQGGFSIGVNTYFFGSPGNSGRFQGVRCNPY